MLEIEVSKRITTPSDAEIKAVYEANRESIGMVELEQVKPQIISFLSRQGSAKATEKYVSELRAKYKVELLKDVNSRDLSPVDVLAKVNGKTLIVKDFEEKAGQSLYNLKASVYERVSSYLETTIYNEMVVLKLKRLILLFGAHSAEVTDKMRDFSIKN